MAMWLCSPVAGFYATLSTVESFSRVVVGITSYRCLQWEGSIEVSPDRALTLSASRGRPIGREAHAQ